MPHTWSVNLPHTHLVTEPQAGGRGQQRECHAPSCRLSPHRTDVPHLPRAGKLLGLRGGWGVERVDRMQRGGQGRTQQRQIALPFGLRLHAPYFDAADGAAGGHCGAAAGKSSEAAVVGASGILLQHPDWHLWEAGQQWEFHMLAPHAHMLSPPCPSSPPLTPLPPSAPCPWAL